MLPRIVVTLETVTPDKLGRSFNAAWTAVELAPYVKLSKKYNYISQQ